MSATAYIKHSIVSYKQIHCEGRKSNVTKMFRSPTHTHLHETWNDTLQNNGVLCIVKMFFVLLNTKYVGDTSANCNFSGHEYVLSFFRWNNNDKKCILGMTKIDKDYKIVLQLILQRNELPIWIRSIHTTMKNILEG